MLFHYEDMTTKNGYDEELWPDKIREQIKGVDVNSWDLMKESPGKNDTYWDPSYLREVAFELLPSKLKS